MPSRSVVRCWTHEPLPASVREALERVARIDDVVAVAAMPDVHLAGAVCVGSVVATKSRLFPGAVGGDIGCGMAAVRLEADAELLGDRNVAARVLSMLGHRVPIASRRSAVAVLPGGLAARELSAPGLCRKRAGIGRVQFGTLGKGNHFVEFQRDEQGGLWLMLHSGSRGMGQAIREHHGGAADSLVSLCAESPAGQAYLADLQWALEYAQQSRRYMVDEVCAGLGELMGVGVRWSSYLDCHHNFVRHEQHAGQWLWVHRKGSISASKEEPGIIPGSMGTSSFHVAGRGQAESFCSSSHGAGRAMSRVEARRAISARLLGEQMRGVWFDHRLTKQPRDEAPGAYKDIGVVMRAQRDLTRIVRRLTPVLVYKGN